VAGEVGIKIKVSAKDAKRNLERLQNLSRKLASRFQKVEVAASRMQTRISKSFQKIRRAGVKGFGAIMTKASGLIKRLATLKTAFAGLAIGAVATTTFKAAAELERMTLQLKTLTGSAKTAKDIMAELTEINKAAPFELPDLVNAAAKLSAYGIANEDLTDITERLGKVAAGVGRDIDGIALAFGQAQAKGRLMGEELRQFIERGVPVREELEKITKTTGAAFDELMSKGKVSADQLTQAIINMTSESGRFGNAFENTANSLDTKLSNLQDAFFQSSAALGNAFKPVFSFVLDKITEILNAFTGMIKGIQKDLDALGARLSAGQEAGKQFRERFGTGRSAVEKGKKAGITKDSLTQDVLNTPVEDELVDSEAAKTELVNTRVESLKTELEFLEKHKGLNSAALQIERQILTLKEKNPNLDEAQARKDIERINALQKQRELTQQIQNIMATGMTNAVMGLIDGTKTLSQSLAGVARQLASMFLNRAFSSLFGSFFGEQGGYSRAGGFKAFQYGGVVNSPTLGMVGEGGEPEYIIPASKMDGAMSRYSAGARGGAVIPGGSHEAGTVAGASGNTVVEYTGPVLNFNGDDYVPKDAVPRIISTAAQQGASMGQSKMMSTLKNSRSQRSKIGI